MSEPYICLVCLRTDRNLKEISTALSVYHDDLIDYSLQISDPKYCSECACLLRKSFNFRQKCIKAANTLNKWIKISKKKRTSLDLLHLEIPQLTLDLWTPESSKVFTYDCSGNLYASPTEINSQNLVESSNTDHNVTEDIKDEIIENTAHTENLLKLEIHCDNNKITRVKETVLNNFSKVSEDTTNIFQNKLTIDNTTTNPRPSNTIEINKSSKLEKINDITNQANNKITNIMTQDNINKLNTKAKKRKLSTINDMPILNAAKTCKSTDDTLKPSNDNTKPTNDVTKPRNDITKPTNDITNPTNDLSELTDNVINENIINDANANNSDNEIICLDDDVNDNNDIIIINDEIDYPDDASLNSNDDCDDYLYSTKELPKHSKIKMTLDELADIVLSDEDIHEEYVFTGTRKYENEKCKKEHLTTESLQTERNIIEKLNAINESLDSICENWNMASLLNMRISNITSDKVNNMSRKIIAELIEKNALKQDGVKKKHINANLTYVSSALDVVNKKCETIIDDYKNNLIDPKERLKTQLIKRYECSGELKAEDGTVFNKDDIISSLDMVTERQTKRLLHFLQSTNSKALSHHAAVILKQILNRHQDKECESIFDIQYMNTEQEIIAEFQLRKTYDCYVLAEYKCDICYQGFKHKGLLENHMSYHDERKGTETCKICGFRCKTRRRFYNHRASHEAVYKCKLCPLVTYYRMSMINHYEQHKGIQYKCEKCELTYKSKSVYLQHQSSVHPRGVHVCTTCGRCFVSSHGLKTHISRKHEGQSTNLDGAGVKCEMCELTFPTEQAQHIHMRTLHKTKKRLYKERKQMILLKPRKKPTLTCRVCNAEGHSNSWLTFHFNTEHPTVEMGLLYADRQMFLCDVCGKGFTNKYHLGTHMNVHTGVTLPCPTCGKRFNSRVSLAQHKLRHGPRAYCCEHCGRKFYSNANLYNHRRTHIGDRRFKCSVCGKGFLYRAALTEHVKGVHKHERRIRKRVTRVAEKTHGVEQTTQGVDETPHEVDDTTHSVNETANGNTDSVGQSMLGV